MTEPRDKQLADLREQTDSLITQQIEWVSRMITLLDHDSCNGGLNDGALRVRAMLWDYRERLRKPIALKLAN